MIEIAEARTARAPLALPTGRRKLALFTALRQLALVRAAGGSESGASHTQPVGADVRGTALPEGPSDAPAVRSYPPHPPDAHAVVDALYQRHARTVLTYLYHRLPELADAEDALADVFVAALRAAATGSADTLELPWLLAVARRRVADFYRQRSRTQQRAYTSLDSVAGAAIIAPGVGPEEAALRSEERGQLLALVTQLPDEQRDALALRFIGGLKSPQIAAILGKSEEATRALISRATRRLRKEWAE